MASMCSVVSVPQQWPSGIAFGVGFDATAASAVNGAPELPASLGIIAEDRTNAFGGGRFHRYWSLALDCGRLPASQNTLSVQSKAFLFHSRPLHRFPKSRTRSSCIRIQNSPSKIARHQPGKRSTTSLQSTRREEIKKHTSLPNFQADTAKTATPVASGRHPRRIRPATTTPNRKACRSVDSTAAFVVVPVPRAVVSAGGVRNK
mmetsp:Transcript_18821/g.43590  ORF Transcript_18821/g.43590 Transcript_18821/m.43590 type:complete len:204 (-) Transcript_18821:776-1387(-)